MTKKEMDNNKNISPKKRNKMNKKKNSKSDSEPEFDYEDEEYDLKNSDGIFKST